MKGYRWTHAGMVMLVPLIVIQSGWGQRSRNLPPQLRTTEQRRADREMQRMKRRMEAIRRKQKEAMAKIPKDLGIQKALGVTEAQWKVIKPHFDRVRNLMREARVGIGVASGSVGGSVGMGGGGFTSGGGTGLSGGSAGGGSFGGGSGGGYSIQGSSTGGNDPCDTKEEYHEEIHNQPIQWHWNWMRPSSYKTHLTRGERACEALLDAVQDKNSTPEVIAAKLAALKAARKAARDQLPKARAELRQVLDEKQQLLMTVMGYL